MGMFDALIPQNQDTDLGNESYEEIVDCYCGALEDVESEIAGLESLSDAIDNADAFAAAIESCGGSVSPALMQFGYAVDPAFGQLIGRECPSDFATENMEEFGSFALESIKTKLVVAWEAVKTFIVKIWEKIKEFCRWVLRLFDRKKQRLEAIVKKAKDRIAKNKGEIKKADKKEIKAYDKSTMNKVLQAVSAAYTNTTNWIVLEGDYKSLKIGPAVELALKYAGWQKAKSGDFEDIMKKSSGEAKVQKFDALGFNSCNDIIEVAQKVIDLMNKRSDVEKGVKLIEGVKAQADSYTKTMAKFDDPADKDTDKKDADEIRAADKAKAQKLIGIRRHAILSSKMVVAVNKEVNNIAASIIQIAGIAGL